MKIRQEQLLIIITTTVALLTAWSWNDFFREFIQTYYGNSLSISFLVAITTSIIMFLFINWVLEHLDYEKRDIEIFDDFVDTYLQNYTYHKPKDKKIIEELENKMEIKETNK